jgi:hypothetical protein
MFDLDNKQLQKDAPRRRLLESNLRAGPWIELTWDQLISVENQALDERIISNHQNALVGIRGDHCHGGEDVDTGFGCECSNDGSPYTTSDGWVQFFGAEDTMERIVEDVVVHIVNGRTECMLCVLNTDADSPIIVSRYGSCRKDHVLFRDEAETAIAYLEKHKHEGSCNNVNYMYRDDVEVDVFEMRMRCRRCVKMLEQQYYIHNYHRRDCRLIEINDDRPLTYI